MTSTLLQTSSHTTPVLVTLKIRTKYNKLRKLNSRLFIYLFDVNLFIQFIICNLCVLFAIKTKQNNTTTTKRRRGGGGGGSSEVNLEQWNQRRTKRPAEFVRLHNEVSFFSIYFTITGVKKIFSYIKEFVI